MQTNHKYPCKKDKKRPCIGPKSPVRFPIPDAYWNSRRSRVTRQIVFGTISVSYPRKFVI